MRITESSLVLASSHAVSASLQGRRQARPGGAELAAPQRTVPATGHTAPPPAVTEAAASGNEASVDAADANVDAAALANDAWLLLVRLTGDGGAARELAQRVARLAMAVEPHADISQAMQRLAAEFAAIATASSATAGQAAPAEGPGQREDGSATVTETGQTALAAAGIAGRLELYA